MNQLQKLQIVKENTKYTFLLEYHAKTKGFITLDTTREARESLKDLLSQSSPGCVFEDKTGHFEDILG